MVLARPLIMGVVNVTPDSFSDGGAWFSTSAAIAHAEQLVADGAAILDIGGESTRPGAVRPAEDEEWRRVIPVIRGIVDVGVPVSIDTMRARVAAAALDAGASIVNDVSGGAADPDMGRVVAEAGVDYIAMHWRGHSVDMQSRAVYDDVVADVCREAHRPRGGPGGGGRRSGSDRAGPGIRLRQARATQLGVAAGLGRRGRNGAPRSGGDLPQEVLGSGRAGAGLGATRLGPGYGHGHDERVCRGSWRLGCAGS